MTTRSWSNFATPELRESHYATGTDGATEIVDGVIRPKWNPYEVTSWKQKRTRGKVNFYGSISDIWADGAVLPPSGLTANDQLTLLSRLSEKVKGHNFNLAVNVAQGKQTVDMVIKAVTDISGAISDLKKGRFASAARRFGVNERTSRLSKNDVAGRWLELQYGWLPIFNDVYEAAKAYESLTSKRRSNIISESLTRTTIFDSSASPSNWTCLGPRKDRVRIIYEMTEELSVGRSLGLMDPWSVAWEVIPYSFVYDWFMPIGTYLENLNTIPKLKGRFLTTECRWFNSSAVKAKTNSANIIVLPTCHFSYFHMKRTPSLSLTVPKPGFNTLPDAMSPKRIWNAIALATQRLR